ncbi:MAG: C10 family peptidase [Candidatus Zixiibacteriota bacterium]|nr:MAG: C10 family peptidase [candidate division Zixibacteria bacterium]
MSFKKCLMILSLLFAVIAIHASSRAETASEEEMRLVCRNWLSYIVSQKGSWAGATEPELTEVIEITVNDTLLGRCFNIVPEGFVVVPILKDLPPIKASSEESHLDFNLPGIPKLLSDVLSNRTRLFVRIYGSLKAGPPDKADVRMGRQNRRAWDYFLQDEKTFDAALLDSKLAPLEEVGPLLTSYWHQEEPYNLFCPTGVSGLCYVGCGATAITQILYYHRWPLEGVGNYSYWWWGDWSCDGYDPTPGCTLSADFSDPYDWDNILDIYGGSEPLEQQHAVAELCYEAGVAHNMSYGCCGSGAVTEDPIYFLPQFFRYRDQIQMVFRNDYDSTQWFNMIKTEVNEDRPIFYNIPGHFIIGDGWRETGYLYMVHMNYGWGGSNNMWYALDNLYCPWEVCEGGEDIMLLGIEPNKDVYFTADRKWAQVPFQVAFTGAGTFPNIDTWVWDFGDGESSYEQSPVHTYQQGGRFDVTLQAFSGGESRSYTASNYITALADSMLGLGGSGFPGATVEVDIYASNTVPLSGIRIPVEYGGTLNIRLDSFSTAGCRSDLFEFKQQIHFNPFGKQSAFSLFNADATLPELAPGAGSVLRLYFTIPSSASQGQTASITLDGYSSYVPIFYWAVMNYEPILGSGMVWLSTGPYMCGDANNDENVDLLDVLYLIDHLYGDPTGPAPIPPPSGDVNGGDGNINLLDILYLIAHLYDEPPGPPPDCP